MHRALLSLLLLGVLLLEINIASSTKLVVITVATDSNDAFLRWQRTADEFKYETKVVGLGEVWKGGEMEKGVGGGHKINLLKRDLESFKDQADTILMFTDSYDVVFTQGPEELLRQFKRFNARLVFSAEGYCWPNIKLASQYPAVGLNEKRFLCSGGYIGYAPEFWQALNMGAIDNTGDDQLYYTHMYIDKAIREKLQMKLDTKSQIFQNLHGAVGTKHDDVEVSFESGDKTLLKNIRTGFFPIVVHANGPTKVKFANLANYLGGAWTMDEGCRFCKDNTYTMPKQRSEWPTVLLAMYIDHPTPFIKEWFEKIAALDYPKDKIHLYLYCKERYHFFHAAEFVRGVEAKYASVTFVQPKENINGPTGKNKALALAKEKGTDFYFNVDSDGHIDDPAMLVKLIEQNRDVLSPLLQRPGQLWSSFWGDLNQNGYYARSKDYSELLNRERTGVWNVPYVNYVYLVKKAVVARAQDYYTHQEYESDMAFCYHLRSVNTIIYMTNLEKMGHLVNSDDFDTSKYHPDMGEIFNNPTDWEARYLHVNYSQALKPGVEITSPCPDVYWFPIVTDIFCEHLIQTMENFDGWSAGKNEDKRLDGGYENVPTVDVHMKQVGLEDTWLKFLRKYVSPLQQVVFQQYHHEGGPQAYMNFVVRYHPQEQNRLVPHHDASTYTINIALNRPFYDFEGGGCRFLRYNCSVTAPRKGWMFMHPGRLTHLHEGLLLTKGIRYIMVSFIDP